MKFSLITGPASTIQCTGCGEYGLGGTDSYTSASTGQLLQPSATYSEEGGGTYCASCAAKLTTQDPTIAVNRFYTDTTGDVIDYARLEEIGNGECQSQS